MLEFENSVAVVPQIVVPERKTSISGQGKQPDSKILEILNVLNPDMSYPDWLKVGMALHSEGYGVSLWDEWSKKGEKYEPHICENKWESFSPLNDGVKIGTLIRMAKDAGWTGVYKSDDPASAKGRLTPIAFSNIKFLPKREYLVKGLLDKTSLSTVFGESNCGKTFVAIDLAFHITLGKLWRGMKVNQGTVVYIAAEGGMGLKDRMEAFFKYHNLKEYPSFYLIPAGVDLCNNQDDSSELIKQIQKIDNVQLVVVDTLSRAMAGGNENSPDDMGAFIKNCDLIREATKAHVMIIHHSGKDSSKGARGHSALRAAVDTEIEVKKISDSIIATVTKQRDGATDIRYGFVLRPVDLGKDDEGEEIGSCVVVASDAALVKKKELSGQKKKALTVLKDLIAQEGEARQIGMTPAMHKSVSLESYKDALTRAKIVKSDKPDNTRRSISNVIFKLENDRIISVLGGFVWITDNSRTVH